MQRLFGGLVIILVSLAAQAQTFTGVVAGRVIDAQHAMISSARLTLSNSARGYERNTTTNSQGEYSFQLVPPGEFTLRAEAIGFVAATLRIEVVVATTIRVDLSLGIQSLPQTVDVVGESGIAVQTEAADLGRTISPHEMAELPSLTRSPYDFMALMPGAVASNDTIGVGFAVNGARTQSGNYLLDGSENNDSFMSAPAQDVPLDAIEEFSVQTNHYSAEYGRNSGFVANIVTKAGTNHFHGSVYDYLRNSALAANPFDNNAHGFPRPVFNRHQFGGTSGGPLRPGKLFFFISMEPIRVRSTTLNPFYVPTPQLLAISSPGTQSIFERYPVVGELSSTDFLTATVCPFGVKCNSQMGAGTVTIPTFASTTRAGPEDVGAGPPQNTVLGTGRVDWAINSKLQAFTRYAFEDKDVFATVTQPYSSQLDQSSTARNHNIALNLIGIWSPRVATESRFVYNRVTGDPERFGGDVQTAPQPPFPCFQIQNEPAVLPCGGEQSSGPQNFYQFFQTATWVRGQHTLKFGGQFVHLRENITYGIGELGDATFSDAQGFADGVLRSYQVALNPKGHFPGEFVDPPFGPPDFTRHFRYNQPGLFVDDIWRVTPRLTLTPGLRWEYFGQLHSPGTEHTLDSNFYLGAGDTLLEQIASGHFLRTVDAPGDLRGRFYLPSYKNFAPRLGVAYDLFGDGRTVIRSGLGVFYDQRVGWEMFRVFLNPPDYSLPTLTDIPVTSALLVNPYAALPDAAIQLSQSDAKPIATHLRTAYTLSWNVTVEHDLKGNFIMGASYLGSSGAQLYSINDLSRMGSGGLLDSSCLRTRFAADGITPLGPDYTHCPGLNPNVSALNTRENGGHSSYQALQLRLDSGRLARWGAEFGVNYTWSHSIDNDSVSGLSGFLGNTTSGHLSAFQPSLDRGSSDFDVRHRISAHWIWEIPVRRNSHTWTQRYLLGGWGVSGLVSYQTGQPFSIYDSGVPDFTFNGSNTRPRLTGAQPRINSLVPDAASPNTFLYIPINLVYDATGDCIAGTTPFACEISVNGPFDGTLSRNTFRQPGTYYQNAALLKNLPLAREDLKLQIRAEFYNLFNHPNLYVRGGTNDVNASSFNPRQGQTVPGVTAAFRDSRQIVIALKLIF